MRKAQICGSRARRRLLAVGALTVAAFVFVPGPSAAFAGGDPAMTSGGAATMVRVEAPLKVTGFDWAIAKQNGYEIRTTADGREYSVKVGAATNGTVTPANVVEGNCGDSWVEFDATGSLNAQLGTGFDLDSVAVSYRWRVAIADQVGVGTKSWGGALAARKTWSAVTTTHSGARGSAFAQVITPYSEAVLANGAVCVSGGPTSFTSYF